MVEEENALKGRVEESLVDCVLGNLNRSQSIIYQQSTARGQVPRRSLLALLRPTLPIPLDRAHGLPIIWLIDDERGHKVVADAKRVLHGIRPQPQVVGSAKRSSPKAEPPLMRKNSNISYGWTV